VGRLSSGMLVGSADTHRMLMVMMVEPASLGSMSIRKGECGVEELRVAFFGRRRYMFVILFIVGLVWVHWELRGPHSPKNELKDGDEVRWG
jgi:hypothetical protein